MSKPLAGPDVHDRRQRYAVAFPRGATPAIRRVRVARRALWLAAGVALGAAGLLGLAATGARRPGQAAPADPGLLIARARVAQPHLVAVPGGFVGWWLEGASGDQSLVVARLSAARGLIVRRALSLAALAPGERMLDAPLFAPGPGRRLLFTYRALDRRMRQDSLFAASWNTSLRGTPRVSRLRVDPLVSTQRAIDYGPHGQYLSYQPRARSFLLAEEDVRPWLSANPQLPNRPQLLVTLISRDGLRHVTRVLALPAAESFIDPLVRAVEDVRGFDLFVARAGDTTAAGLQPDTLLLYRLDDRLRKVQPSRRLVAVTPDWSIIDEAVTRVRSGAELLVWEEDGPETGLGEAKAIVGTVVRRGRLTRPPAILSTAISPRTIVPAQLSLVAQPGGELLSFNTGTAVVFETVRTDGISSLRVLLHVRHPVYLQPQTALAYNPGARMLAGLWQDPGRAQSPDAVAAAAPLYLDDQATP